MNKLFNISKVDFYEEDFQDNINEFEDIIPIIQDLEKDLSLERIQCVDLNDCCNKSKENLFAEIQGFVDEEGEFYLKDEAKDIKKPLDLFVIRIYKCVSCKKWMIDILE
ncbi:hypothetical protein [Clostridium fallax]|uniref:Uncharacterized protein n=1 Tax=Clostridium fallax TaxID=1533 RepID=A0A1M4YA71_9CLOT|nr:hypothetical protein [Clostridium fallax]SHF02528.1 hypothetical protein SAMN05443638_12530 [Clostridium fallax]SQB06042.1 Uncharacterised protein [Clostridium fallax]